MLKLDNMEQEYTERRGTGKMASQGCLESLTERWSNRDEIISPLSVLVERGCVFLERKEWEAGAALVCLQLLCSRYWIAYLAHMFSPAFIKLRLRSDYTRLEQKKSGQRC